jgi:subtilisin-like proprotein convertase family protein
VLGEWEATLNARVNKRLHIGMAVITSVLMAGMVFAGTAQAATTVKKTFTSNTPVTIPDRTPHVDGSTGHGTSYLQVEGLLGNITKVTVSAYITHGRTADLDAALIGPDAQTYSYLFTPLASNGTSFGTSCADSDRMAFDDSAGASVDQGTSPFVGTYRPMDSLGLPLSVFNGNAGGSNGTWAFDVFDEVQGNTGTIQCWSLSIQTDAGQLLRFDSVDTPVDITDAVTESGGPGVGTSSITASGLPGNVSNVTVSVYVSHTQVSDLDVVLISPTGQQVKLAARVGGTGNDFGKSCTKMTTFDDAAKTSISQGVAPYVGTFHPSQPLSGARGGAANGEWRLQVTDNAATKTGQINCWSLSVSATAAPSTPAGVILSPKMTAPKPLPGTRDYAYFTIFNNTPNPLTNVTLTGSLPLALSDVRENTDQFPSCDANVLKFTCTWPVIFPGMTVIGGVMALVGNPNKGKICFNGAVTATELSAVKASSCFAQSTYPAGDHGTGYVIGDVAHDLALQDQNGNPVSLSNFAGKYVLLDFTAVWCPPSNFEVPQDRDEIAALNASNAMGVPVVYLTVLIDGPTPNVASTKVDAVNWKTHFHLTTPVLFTQNDTNLVARQEQTAYDIDVGLGLMGAAYPTSIFIRPNGTVFDVRVGAELSGGTTSRFLADLP